MLDAELLELAKGIAAELYSARQGGRLPVAIVVDPVTCARLETARLGLHRRSGQRELFNLPLRVEAGTEGWTVRTR